MSLIFEFRVSKDDILETYLNIIYLGQNGVFEVRGYGSAAEFYFQKPVDRLNLSECALLAAIVNSPGRYHPILHPERALERRDRVLDKMLEHQMISAEESDQARQQALPKAVKQTSTASAPYYLDAVNKKLIELGITDRSGLSVYTAMNPRAQALAEKAVRQNIENFEKSIPSIAKIKKEKGLPLQATLIASDPVTGEVSAVVGGRDFASSPYNRAVEARRQVGSIFKPIVYLTALLENSEQFQPLSLIDNSPLKHEYDRQVWEPRNYDQSFSGPLPLFYALKESINVPTARLGLEVGLDEIIATSEALGVTSRLKAFPALSLGAFELSPLEVLTVYNTFSQMGLRRELQIIKLVSNDRGDILYSFEPQESQAVDGAAVSVLVGMLKETLISGTGRFARQMGFDLIAAGKTGTTSDTRDAWFAGFTPLHTAVVWVGYDEGASHQLTGASLALPIWTQYMKAVTSQQLNREFAFSPETHVETVSAERLLELGVPIEKARTTELVFKNQ